MISILAQRRAEVEALCRRYHVRRLELFGSAASGQDQPGESDLHEKVEIAFAGLVLTGRGRAEQLQAPHMVTAAKGFDFRPALSKNGDHGVFSFWKRIAQRRARFSLIVARRRPSVL